MLPDVNSVDSENEYDSESGLLSDFLSKKYTLYLDRHRSLWKRKTTIGPSANLKRRCVINSESAEKSMNSERDKRKVVQRTLNANLQQNSTSTGRRLRLNNDSSSSQSDETTYCLCSQVRRTEIIESAWIFLSAFSSLMVQ